LDSNAAAYAAIVSDRDSDELDSFAIAFAPTPNSGSIKLETLFQDRDPVSAERILNWLAEQLPSIPENPDFISPRRVAAGLCVRLYLQLRPEEAVLKGVLENLANVEGGMALGAQLVSEASGHFFSGSAEEVEFLTSAYANASVPAIVPKISSNETTPPFRGTSKRATRGVLVYRTRSNAFCDVTFI
jgi:hypothetical protein